MSASPPSSPIDSTNSSSTIIDVTTERGEEFMLTELNSDGFAADEDDETEFEHKFALKLDLQEDVDLTQDGIVTHKTKSILETTDDHLICQIFSQTITSATVTPTDEDQIFYNNFSATIEERTDSETENDLSPMQTQQPPSIVVDCCDENDDGGGDSGETSGSTGAKRFNETADIDLDDLDAKKISSIYFDITIEEDFVDIEVPISVVQNEDGEDGEEENISYDEPLEILKQKSKEEDENGNENEENAEENKSNDNEHDDGDDVVADADSIENLMEKKDASISNESLSTQEYEEKDEQDELLSMEDQLPGDIKQDSDLNEKQVEIGDAPMSDSTDEIRCNGQQKTKSQEPVSESESISENNVSVKTLITKKSARKNSNRTPPADGPNMVREEFIKKCVSVKHLCRSFGDLSTLNDEHNKETYGPVTINRAKSVGDIRKLCSMPIVTGVSVKTLRNNFVNNNVYGLKHSKHYHQGDCRSSQISLGLTQFDMKSSFEKFDSICSQSRIDQSINNGENNCKVCGKIAFQMEQIKAERSIWHRNCFRCKTCHKQLNVDTYESHEGTVYCRLHFKELFEPKATLENPEADELIISENQPVELPPDVARASYKTDLGLDELQQLDVKSKFHLFENSFDSSKDEDKLEKSANGVRRSSSILSKLAKFQESNDEIHKATDYTSSDELESIGPIKLHDIKTRFETGSVSPRPEHLRNEIDTEADICDMAKTLKEKFEKGEIKSDTPISKSNDDTTVCEPGICKKSRSMFMELDVGNDKICYSPKTEIKHSQSNGVKYAAKNEYIPRDPNMARADDKIDDAFLAEQSHTASKMLSIFRQLEENNEITKTTDGMKPLKRFNPPPQIEEVQNLVKGQITTTEVGVNDDDTSKFNSSYQDDEFLMAAHTDHCAKKLKEQIEKWEKNELQTTNNNNNNSNEIKQNGSLPLDINNHNSNEINTKIHNSHDEHDTIVESAKSICEKFESMRYISSDQNQKPKEQSTPTRIRVNNFM